MKTTLEIREIYTAEKVQHKLILPHGVFFLSGNEWVKIFTDESECNRSS